MTVGKRDSLLTFLWRLDNWPVFVMREITTKLALHDFIPTCFFSAVLFYFCMIERIPGCWGTLLVLGSGPVSEVMEKQKAAVMSGWRRPCTAADRSISSPVPESGCRYLIFFGQVCLCLSFLSLFLSFIFFQGLAVSENLCKSFMFVPFCFVHEVTFKSSCL